MHLSIKHLIIIVLSGLYATNIHAISLIDAYTLARENDPTFQAAFYTHEAGQQFKVLGRSNLLPVITANYSHHKNTADIEYDGVNNNRTEHRDYDSQTASIQLRQPLINFDGYARYKQGLAQTSLSDQEFSIRIQELILRTFNLYAAVLYAEDVLLLAQSKRDAFMEQKQANIHLFKNGEGTKTDILESQAQYDLAEAEIVEAQNSLDNSRTALNKILGREFDAINPLSSSFEVFPVQPAQFSVWKEIAEESNLELIVQRYTLEIAREEVKRSQAGHLPRLDAVASWSQSESDTINTFNQEVSVQSIGLQLTVPIFSGGSVTALTRQAQSKLQKAQAELDAKSNAIIVELQKQFNAVLNAKRKIDALKVAVNSASLLVEATKKSVKGGVRTNFDVLNTESQFFEAKRNLSLEKYNYLQSYLKLKKIAGTLSLNDLNLVAGYFEK
ncbi:MAG: TolC family outer membrane protein [Methylophilaceae bacterium]